MPKRATAKPVKKKAGRPRHQPDQPPSDANRVHVERMAAFGMPEEQIAAVIGISEPTLRLHYRNELDTGLLKANYAVANNLYAQATRNDPRAFNAIKFWLNCRAGWSEYAPAPPLREPRAEPLGKKEIADREAETGIEGTTWGDVLPSHRPN